MRPSVHCRFHLLYALSAALLLVGRCRAADRPAGDLRDPASPRTLAGFSHLSLPGPYWHLRFSDEFNGLQLSTDKWRHLLPWGGAEDGHWHTDGYASYITEADAIVSGGNLRLTCRKTDTKGKRRTFHYTAGMITTAQTFRFVHGYAEIRAQAPMEAGPGLWPAFWTLADGWPPECDIVELWTAEPRIHQGYCWAKPKRGQDWDSYHAKIGPRGYHTYAMEWGPGYIFFSVDGKINKRIHGPHVTDKPQYLLLNSAVCSGKGNIGPTDATVFPNSFDVDYCRVYARPPVIPFHDSGFEDPEDKAWKRKNGAAADAKTAHGGRRALRLETPEQSAAQQLFGLAPATTYQLAAWTKSVDRNQPIRLGIRGHGGEPITAAATQSVWWRQEICFTTGPTNCTATVFCENPVGPGGWFDDFAIRPVASPKTGVAR